MGEGGAWRRDCLVGHKRVRRAHSPGIASTFYLLIISPRDPTDRVASLRAAAAIFVYSARLRVDVSEPAASPCRLLTVQCSPDQQGSINEQTLTIRSQLWLSAGHSAHPASAQATANVALYLADNGIIRESVKGRGKPPLDSLSDSRC